MTGRIVPRSPHHTIAEIVAQLMWGPKTEHQIDEAVGTAKSVGKGRFHHALHILRDAGVIRVREFDSRNRPVWEMQTSPFALPDADAPAGMVRRGPAPQQCLGGKMVSVSELARLAGISCTAMSKRLRTMTPEQAVALPKWRRPQWTT